MLTFYLVLSLLWGILMFLNSFRKYKWYVCATFVITGIVFWPLFVLVEVVATAIREFRKKDEPAKTETELKKEEVLNIIREKFDTTYEK